MNTAQSVQIEVTLNSKDLRRYVVHYYRRNIILSVLSVLAILFLIITMINEIRSDVVTSSHILYAILVIICIVILFLPVIIYLLLLTTGRNFGLMKVRKYTITKKEIVIDTLKKRINFPVNQISRITETKRVLYIWQKHSPQILPKRFMTEDNIEFIKTLNK